MVVRPLGSATETNNKFPALSAKEPPTQGHHRDMGTIQNTAAIYVRRFAADSANTEAALRIGSIEDSSGRM